MGESLNIGILFYFPEENFFEFVTGDSHRAKSVYPDFDNSLFSSYLKAINNKVKKHVDLFNESTGGSDFAKYIHNNILAEDAAGLIFRAPVNVKNVFKDRKNAIDEYSRLLLPGINVEKPSIFKHNENYIIKTFSGYIFGKDKSLENKFKKNEILKTKHFDIKFDLSWEKTTHNYIKPISFDFTDEISIQHKSAVLYGFLVDLKGYNKKNKYSFNFLLAKPQKSDFQKTYENALDLIYSVKSSGNLYPNDQWQKFSENVLDELSQ